MVDIDMYAKLGELYSTTALGRVDDVRDYMEYAKLETFGDLFHFAYTEREHFNSSIERYIGECPTREKPTYARELFL